jgi:hypothetical protein
MAKIVYNECYGGFGLSQAGVRRYLELKGVPFTEESTESSFHVGEFRIGTSVTGESEYFSKYDIKDRADPILVQVVEELGDAANGSCAELCIRELAPGTRYMLREYDGSEWIETEDEMEWSIA